MSARMGFDSNKKLVDIAIKQPIKQMSRCGESSHEMVAMYDTLPVSCLNDARDLHFYLGYCLKYRVWNIRYKSFMEIEFNILYSAE